MSITTHVLDTALGRPAAGLAVTLDAWDGRTWHTVSRAVTDADGRVKGLLPADQPLPYTRWRLIFDTAGYFQWRGTATFYPLVEIVFDTPAADQHYHVPLLLSPFGYSTYRGS